MDSSVSLKDQIWFLRVCHHVSIVLYHFDWGRSGAAHSRLALASRRHMLLQTELPRRVVFDDRHVTWQLLGLRFINIRQANGAYSGVAG